MSEHILTAAQCRLKSSVCLERSAVSAGQTSYVTFSAHVALCSPILDKNPVITRRGKKRMLPNPTNDQWRKKTGSRASWKITRLMEVFQEKVDNLIGTEGFSPGHSTWKIKEEWEAIKSLGCTDEALMDIEVREAIHDSIERITTYLLEKKQAEVLGVLVAHVTKVVHVLENPVSRLNTIVLANPNKEEALLEYYFSIIREEVAGNSDEKNAIWVALIYRMLCWFLLHDFDKSDVNMVPSILKGSRMPVYIG